VKRDGKNIVLFLIKENRAIETPVTTGEAFGDMTEVLSGVKAGDRVAIEPLDKLRNGRRVKVAEK
jgi:multidrug efflux pump subunit AcrA (membrane-fusion protein)